jgi:hypothetical protein
MVSRIDDEPANSWLQRSRAERMSAVVARAETGHVAAAPDDKHLFGWDPWEVWLRHIDRPRRPLAARRVKQPDSIP